MTPEPKNILITGASSGIGAALARIYAGPGVTLFLGGRDRGRLAAVAEGCEHAGARARPTTMDVTDADACARWIAQADAQAPLDLVVANAGISAGTGGHPLVGETPDIYRRILAVNVDGVVNTVLPAIGAFRARGRGQIAVVSSLASFLGSPGAAAYCASKAAERILGEALRGELAAEGISVSVVCPGFIRTPMTDGNDFPMPFLMDADEAARRIRKGLARNKARIAFPWPLYALVRVGAMLPVPVIDLLMRRLPRKN